MNKFNSYYNCLFALFIINFIIWQEIPLKSLTKKVI